MCMYIHNYICIYMHPCIIQELTVDMAHFMERVAEFDRRLATILNHTFQDCSGCEAAFKVWVSILMVYIIQLACIYT